MQFCYFFLFILDAVDGILSSGAPTLDDDGDKGDGGDSQQRNGEKPPIDRRTLSETLQPLVADIPSQWGSNDKTADK